MPNCINPQCGSRGKPRDAVTDTCPTCGNQGMDAKGALKFATVNAPLPPKGTAEQLAAQARAARDLGMALAAGANPSAHQIAMELIRRRAKAVPEVLINDFRDQFDNAGIPSPNRGTAFTAAVKAKWIKPVSLEVSTGKSAHAKNVTRYESLIYGTP